ncbi:MAG: hypothetical protein ACE5MG_07970, partial [Candidatus Methylomirabilales bacterium]
MTRLGGRGEWGQQHIRPLAPGLSARARNPSGPRRPCSVRKPSDSRHVARALHVLSPREKAVNEATEPREGRIREESGIWFAGPRSRAGSRTGTARGNLPPERSAGGG